MYQHPTNEKWFVKPSLLISKYHYSVFCFSLLMFISLYLPQSQTWILCCICKYYLYTLGTGNNPRDDLKSWWADLNSGGNRPSQKFQLLFHLQPEGGSRVQCWRLICCRKMLSYTHFQNVKFSTTLYNFKLYRESALVSFHINVLPF